MHSYGNASETKHISRASNNQRCRAGTQGFCKRCEFRIVARRASHESRAHFEITRDIIQPIDVICVGVRRENVIDPIQPSPPEVL
jgi:hypothetical protein